MSFVSRVRLEEPVKSGNSVRIEFYGIPRQRAGVAAIDVNASDLGTALREAGRLLPGFGCACLEGNRLRDGYLANIGGRTFTTEPSAHLSPDDTVLILSADAGG
jgi:molybdopterin converting factor small subunit